MKIIPLIFIGTGTVWCLYNLARYFNWSLPRPRVSISIGKPGSENFQPANRETEPVRPAKESRAEEKLSLLGASRSIIPRKVVISQPVKPIAAEVENPVPVGAGGEVLVTDEPVIDAPGGEHEFGEPTGGESEFSLTDEPPELVYSKQSGEQDKSAIEVDEVDNSGFVSLSNQMGTTFDYPEGESQTQMDESFEELGLSEDAFESDELDELLDYESAKPLDQYMSQYGTVHTALQRIGKAVQRKRRRQDVAEMVREFSQVIDYYRLRNDNNIHLMATEALSIIKESEEKAVYIKYYFDIIKACQEGEDAEFEEEPEGN